MNFQSQAQKLVMHSTIPLGLPILIFLALNGAGVYIKELGNSLKTTNRSVTGGVIAFIFVEPNRALEMRQDLGVMALKVGQNITLQCRPHKSSVRISVA